MIKDFENITVNDIKNTSVEELETFNTKQKRKYFEAQKKYGSLARLINKPTKFLELLNQLKEFEDKVNDDTTVDIVIKDEYDRMHKPDIYSSMYSFVSRYDEDRNCIVIQNFV